MNELISILEKRQTPSVSGDQLSFLSSDYAVWKDGVATLAFPQAEKVASDDTLMYHSWRISTPSVDRMKDIVTPRGCEGYLKNYKANPVVFFNHKSWELPIGKSEHPETGELALRLSDDEILATCFFHGKTEESIQVYDLVKLGFLKGASIGFRPIKGTFLREEDREEGKRPRDEIDFTNLGIRFDEWELLEWSVVGVPCNQDATTLDGIRSILSKGMLAGSKICDPIRRSLEIVIPESMKETVVGGFEKSNEKVEDEPLIVEKKESEEKAPEYLLKADFEKLWEEAYQKTGTHALLQEAVRSYGEKASLINSYDESFSLLKKTLSEQQEAQAEILKLLKECELPGDCIVTDEGSLPHDEPDGDEKEALKTPPLGAIVLMKVCKGLHGLYEYLEHKLSLIEQPKTNAFLTTKKDELMACSNECLKFGRKQYPDHFPKADNSTVAPEQKQEEPKLVEVVETKKLFDMAQLEKFLAVVDRLEKSTQDVSTKIKQIS